MPPLKRPLYPISYNMSDEQIQLIKIKRKDLDLTQKELAGRVGVGLRFIRELEQGKKTLRLDKVNQVLAMFGYRMQPVKDIGLPIRETATCI